MRHVVAVNFFQITSLAAELPLQWPLLIETIFEWFHTMSSAGSNLLVPDCEFSEYKTGDIFFAKQIAFVFLVPIIIAACYFVWAMLFVCSQLKRDASYLNFKEAKDFAVLSWVLGVFLTNVHEAF